MTTQTFVLKLRLLNEWLKTKLIALIERLEKLPPRSLAYTVIALLMWSVIILAALLLLTGCGGPQVVMQPRNSLPPPPDFLMANPPTADLIPKEQQGSSGRNSGDSK